MHTDKHLLKITRRAWEDAAPFRASRRRLKAFTYGRQWDDVTIMPDGRRLTEAQRAVEEGRTPITNNIIRRMIKSIIGHYSRLTALEKQSSDSESALGFSPLCERDARALEELLISGSTIQYVAPESGEISNISPDRFIFRRFACSDASDCTLLGHLVDLPFEDVLLRYSDRSPERARELRAAFRNADNTSSPFPATDRERFASPGLPGTVRVIEVWQHTAVELLRIHDPLEADYTVADPSRLEAFEKVNRRRRRDGEPELKFTYDIQKAWVGTVMTPDGIVLDSTVAARHPYAVRFYPMIDGEVHSAVEDVLDQQKLVNRLVSTLDQIITASAKGVLLYPADQLPDGFTWRDVRRIWSNPSGILPYKRTSKTVIPHQVSAGGSSAGATDLLHTQLQIFDEISGATTSFRRRSSAVTGEGLLRAEMETALISMLDILNSFHEFIISRDNLKNQFLKSANQ